MRVPYSWLGEFVENLPAPDVVAERLTMSGLEVESIERPPEMPAELLVVARIEEKRPHPNADRLSLCTVFDGEMIREIVCGAQNMEAGDHVVLAKPGARMAGGMTIKKSKIRGAVSEGMLCSSAEIGAWGDSPGIIILAESAEPGAAAYDVLGLDDCVFELGITPNRGDCLSIRGVAREVAAVCRLSTSPMLMPSLGSPGATPVRVSELESKGDSPFEVEVEERDGCLAYRGIVVDGLRIGSSPDWMQRRLAACGLRPINNIVDVTNYVLFELGQPLHAFDTALLAGNRISARSAGALREFITLDDETRELEPSDIVICDGSGPVALGGVMGGASTAVSDSTTSIFLEAALFDSARIRSTARRLGLLSDSSYRFERGVDSAMTETALLRAAALIAKTGGGVIRGGVARAGELPVHGPVVRLRPERIERVLGSPVPTGDALAALCRLGIKAGETGGAIEARVPTHRPDIEAEIDLIEEVARIHGYEKFTPEMPVFSMHAAETPPVRSFAQRLRSELAAIGLSEIVALSFCSAEMNRACPGLHTAEARALKLRNPLRADEGEMRKSLLPGLLDALRTNCRNGVRTVDLFCSGRTMAADHGSAEAVEPVEIDALAALICGPRRGREPGLVGEASFADLKAVLSRVARSAGIREGFELVPTDKRPELHPRAAADIRFSGESVGSVGQLHPLLAETLELNQHTYVFEIDSRKLVAYAPRHPGLKQVARFPSSARDVSFLASEELLAGDIVATIDGLQEPLVEMVEIFDDYRGRGVEAGNKALGITVVYRSGKGTLTEEEVSAVHARVVAAVTRRLNISVRG